MSSVAVNPLAACAGKDFKGRGRPCDARCLIVVGVPDHLASDALPHGRQLHTSGHPVDPGKANGVGMAVNGEKSPKGLPAYDLAGNPSADEARELRRNILDAVVAIGLTVTAPFPK